MDNTQHTRTLSRPWNVSVYDRDGRRTFDLELEAGQQIQHFSKGCHPIRGAYSAAALDARGGFFWVYSHEEPRFAEGC